MRFPRVLRFAAPCVVALAAVTSVGPQGVDAATFIDLRGDPVVTKKGEGSESYEQIGVNVTNPMGSLVQYAVQMGAVSGNGKKRSVVIEQEFTVTETTPGVVVTDSVAPIGKKASVDVKYTLKKKIKDKLRKRRIRKIRKALKNVNGPQEFQSLFESGQLAPGDYSIAVTILHRSGRGGWVDTYDSGATPHTVNLSEKQ